MADFDRTRFQKYSLFSSPKLMTCLRSSRLGRQSFLALLKVMQHSIEKGLSLKDSEIRVLFGIHSNRISGLLKLRDEAVRRFGRDAAKLTDGVLVTYAWWHGQRNVALPSFLDEFVKSVSREATMRNGGIVMAYKEDILRSTGGMDFDLSPFFESRHSMRQFASKPVSVGLLVEAVRRAIEASPSVCNRQAWRTYELSSPGAVSEAMAHHSGSSGFKESIPTVLIVTALLEDFISPEERYQSWIDGGMFSQSLLMALHSLGLASIPLNWDVEPARDVAMRQRLRISSSENILMLIGVGHYPDKFSYAMSKRKRLQEVFVPERAIFDSTAQ